MRIAYIVSTCGPYESTRMVWQKQSVFSNVNPADVYYLGNRTDNDKNMLSWGAADDYHSLPYKLLHFFQHSTLDYDWYFIMDDDTYVLTDRFQHHVDQIPIQPRETIYTEGHILTHLEQTEIGIYYSGGAGTLLSAHTYDTIKCNLIQCSDNYILPHWCADICLGYWLRMIPSHEFRHVAHYHPLTYDKEKDDASHALTFHYVNKQELFSEYDAFFSS